MDEFRTGEGEIHLRDYLRVINKRRYTVYTFFIVVFTITLIGTLSTTPIYTASTKVLIEKGEPRNLSMNYAYIPYDPDFYTTQYQLIQSTAVARRVVDANSLAKSGSYFGRKEKGLSLVRGVLGWFRDLLSAVFRTKEVRDLNPKEAEDESRADVIAKTISAGIQVKPVKNSRIVEISYSSTNPELAKLIVNSIASAYMGEVLELNMSSTRYTLNWMTKKAEEEKEKLATAEKSMQEYMRDQNFVALENKMTIIPQKISELNSQLINAETKRKTAETLYLKVKEVSENLNEAETIAVIASDPSLQSLRQQMLKAEQNIMEYSQKYGKKHPLMIRAIEDLNGLKVKKEQETRRIIQSIKNDYELARSNETNLRRLLSETKGEALNLSEKFIEYGVLNREVETNRQLYDALIKKVKEQSITDNVQTVNVLVVEKAETPASPVKPRKAMNLLMGIIFGLFGGIGIALFVEYLDQTIKSPEDAEAKLGVPVLGMIPFIRAPEKPIEGMVINEPTSPFAENYKAIRTALLLSSAEKPPKRILITSTGPEEGKTVTAINLAIAIAQSEYSVLLIDGDLRRPRVHKVFGIANTKGLSTYLAGASDINIMQQGPLPNLSIIPAGPIPPNPSELLSSNRMVEMIDSLSGKFDIIICDSPPLLSVADSLVLHNILDGTIIIARAGETTYDAMKKGLRSLMNLKGHIFGMVINGLDIKKGGYYYYRYHNYYYSSDEE
ncbi:MAG: polysaccharide biosynthesis tyrosine autokinase [Nitrospirae bacterium]|nr:polysaccharide biosynthesis tyrosine autokinase [Nitrospirota bacterium]